MDDDPLTRALATLDSIRRDIRILYATGLAAFILLGGIGVAKLVEAVT